MMICNKKTLPLNWPTCLGFILPLFIPHISPVAVNENGVWHLHVVCVSNCGKATSPTVKLMPMLKLKTYCWDVKDERLPPAETEVTKWWH